MKNKEVNDILKELQIYEEVKDTLFYVFLVDYKKKINFISKNDILNGFKTFKEYKKMKKNIFIIEEFVKARFLGVSEENIFFMSNLSLDLKDIRFCKWYFLGIPVDIIKENSSEIKQENLLNIYKRIKDKKNIEKEKKELFDNVDFNIK